MNRFDRRNSDWIGNSYRLNSYHWTSSIDQDTDLLSLAVTLQSKTFFRRRHLGRALHALILRAISWSDTNLAENVHKSPSQKPYTVSDILELDGNYIFRVSVLNRNLVQAINKAIGNFYVEHIPNPSSPYPPLAVGATVDLDKVPFRVVEVNTRSGANPLAGQVSYNNLALPWVYQQLRPSNKLTFEFICPTLFKSNGMEHPVPMPEWVFGSLMDKWNSFAPIKIPLDLKDVAKKEWQVENINISSVSIPFKNRTTKTGSIGTVTYVAPQLRNDELLVFNLLAEFAFFGGVGKQTTMGFGFCLTYPG